MDFHKSIHPSIHHSLLVDCLPLGNLNRHKKVKHGLNESTESMEEDAVHFLSSWSERARGERSGDDTMDGYDLNGNEGNGNADGNVDGNDVDGSSLDLLDRTSAGRKQRKSTPRKIPRRVSSARGRRGRHNSGTHEDEEDPEEEEEDAEEEAGEEEMRLVRSGNFSSLRFQALTDEGAGFGRRVRAREDYAHELEGEARTTTTAAMSGLKRSRRERTPHYASAPNGDFVAGGLSDSEKDDGEAEEMVDDDSEWLPGDGVQRRGKGAKLDSLIAQKFNSS